MTARRIMGTEIEYGISVPGDPTANPVITSTQVVLAYAAAADIPRSRRARWDYEVESPLRDARGFDLSAPTLHNPVDSELDDLGAHWAEAGLLPERLHVERFRPTVIATGDGGKVTFGRSGTVVDAGGSTPLLEAGEAAGVLMPSGCRMGICFSCVLPMTEGAVRDLRDGSITTAVEGDNVLVQTCISAAAGTCHLDH